MQGSGSLFDKIQHENPEFVLEEGINWAMVIKQGPYSDRDTMIVYKGDRDIGDIVELTANEKSEFLAMMEKYSSLITREISDEINAGKVTLATGMNLALTPGQAAAQTIKVPHFHFSVMRNTPFSSDTLQVTPFDIDISDPVQQKKFGVNQQSARLTENMAMILGKNLTTEHMPTTFLVELPDQIHFASQDNMKKYIEIQADIKKYLVNLSNEEKYQKQVYTDSANKIIQKKHTLGATFSITYDRQLGKYVVLCRITQKEQGAGTGVIEIYGSTIARVNDLMARKDSKYPIGNEGYYTRLALEGQKR